MTLPDCGSRNHPKPNPLNLVPGQEVEGALASKGYVYDGKEGALCTWLDITTATLRDIATGLAALPADEAVVVVSDEDAFWNNPVKKTGGDPRCPGRHWVAFHAIFAVVSHGGKITILVLDDQLADGEKITLSDPHGTLPAVTAHHISLNRELTELACA